MRIYGIDIANQHLDIYSEDENGKPMIKRISNKLKPIVKFLCSIPKESIICAEHTGVYGNLLVQIANSLDFKIALIEGYVISKSFAMEKGKSDLIDSKRIWGYGTRFFDKLRFTTPPNESMHELRELMTLRTSLVEKRKMIKTNLKSVQKQIMTSLKSYQVQDGLIDYLSDQIKDIEQEMELIIQNNELLYENYKLATSVIGVGKTVATELIIHTENFTKIDTAKKAASFSGVCPYPNESGAISKKHRVSKRSNKRLKSILYLAALNACNHNKEFRLYRERKTLEGKHFFLVMNNVANKLLRTVFAVVKSKIPYDPMYICNDPRMNEKKDDLCLVI